jgi:hypothetical protein
MSSLLMDGTAVRSVVLLRKQHLCNERSRVFVPGRSSQQDGTRLVVRSLAAGPTVTRAPTRTDRRDIASGVEGDTLGSWRKGPWAISTSCSHSPGATEHPVRSWVVRQARNLFTDLGDTGTRAKFVLHDRDASFTQAFDAVFQAAGIRVIRSAVQAPRMNSITERWIGSCWTGP